MWKTVHCYWKWSVMDPETGTKEKNTNDISFFWEHLGYDKDIRKRNEEPILDDRRAIDVGEYVGHAILCSKLYKKNKENVISASCYKWRRVLPDEILDKRRSYQEIRQNWQCKDAIRGYDEEQKENIMVDCSDPAEDPLFVSKYL